MAAYHSVRRLYGSGSLESQIECAQEYVVRGKLPAQDPAAQVGCMDAE